ncbi:MAG: hypothetical protein RL313_253, partial [Actinomycetota bacterium]
TADKKDSSCTVYAPVLIAAVALDPSISIARAHEPRVSHLSTVISAAALRVGESTYLAAHAP